MGWNEIGSFRGPAGPAGPQGEPGVGVPGAEGAVGPAGPQGERGLPGVSLDIQGYVATYANLPADPEDGDAYVVTADGKLYIAAEGTYPPDGYGIPFVGPAGSAGSTGATGPAGPTGPTGPAGPAGTTSWNGLTDKPAYIAAGATAADARTAIGAGTSNLTIGTTSTTAKVGDYQPTAANISDSTSTGRAVLTATDAAAARTAIGAGTSNLALGTSSSSAKRGDYQPAAADITDATTTGRSVLTAASQGAARTAIGAGTSDLTLGTTSTTAKRGDYQPTAADITDSTTTGRSVITAASQSAARSAIGAGTSNLALGTTSTTAKVGDYQPASTDITDSTSTGRSVLTAASQSAARSAIGAGTSNLALGTTSTTAKVGDYQPASTDITDATTTGKAVLTAADQSAARTAIGAGTSSLALGTTSTTAKRGDYQPASTDITDATETGKSLLTATDQAAARTAIGAGTSNLTLGTTSSTAKTGDYTPTSTEITTALGFTPENAANKAAANGYASLDSNGRVPVSQLPNSVMTYEGLVNVTTNDPALSDSTGNAGQVYRVSVGGTRDYGSGNITANVGDYLIYSGSVWQVADTTDAVATVNGYTGNITLTKSDVGLGNVDNTSDANKPVSTATQTALDAKEPTITAGTTGQYWRGDKSWQTLNKSSVGLGNVDNTSDADKPVSTATQTALDAKEPTITSGTTAQYWRGDKSWQTLNKSAVGLGNVDNTADASKSVASAAQLTTARTIDGVSFDGTANVTVIAPGTAAATGKTTPADADVVPLVDSAASNVLKKLSWSNIKAAIKAYYDDVTAALTNKDLTSGTNTFPTFNQNTTGSAAKWTTARNLAGNSVDGSANVAFANKFIVQGTADSGLSSAQFLGSLSTGIVKNTTTTGVLSIAAAGTDYVAPSGALGTPSSGTLTNCTGLPISGLASSTSTAVGVGSVELGHASDTTLSRSAAGKLAVEGVDVLLTGGALGTPSSGTLTNCTSLPISGLTSSTSTALGVGSLELGHASDTTLTRSAAGQIAVEGKSVLTEDNTVTVTNKTLTNPTVTNYVESVVAIGTVTTSSTISLTSGTVQTATLTASTACTFTMPTAVAGKSFVLFVKQAASTGNGTATFTGVKWGSGGAPTVTATAGKMDIFSFVSPDGVAWYGSVSQGYTP